MSFEQFLKLATYMRCLAERLHELQTIDTPQHHYLLLHLYMTISCLHLIHCMFAHCTTRGFIHLVYPCNNISESRSLHRMPFSNFVRMHTNSPIPRLKTKIIGQESETNA